jgi:hypothetical protein
MEVATCFCRSNFWKAVKHQFCAIAEMQAPRVAFQDLDCMFQREAFATCKDGTDVALPTIPNEMKQLHRNAPSGGLRGCCGGVALVTLA